MCVFRFFVFLVLSAVTGLAAAGEKNPRIA